MNKMEDEDNEIENDLKELEAKLGNPEGAVELVVGETLLENNENLSE